MSHSIPVLDFGSQYGPADRPPGARAGRLLRAAAPRRARGPGARRSTRSASSSPAARPASTSPGAAADARLAARAPGCPCSASATACSCWPTHLGGEVRARPGREYGRGRCSLTGERRALRRHRRPRSSGLDEPRRPASSQLPPGFHALAANASTARRGHGRRTRAALRRAVPPRGRPHRPAATRSCATSCSTSAAARGDWQLAAFIDETIERDPRAGRRRPGDLRASPAASIRPSWPPCSTRPSASSSDLRLRRQRPAAPGRGRAGRRHASASNFEHRPACRRRHASDFLAALAGVDRSRAEAQDHRRDVHRRLRARGAQPRRRRVPGPGHALPRRDRERRPRPRPRRPRSRPTTTSAACPPDMRLRSWSSRCATCSRTRCAPSAASSACPTRCVWRHPFPGPGLAVRILGEVTAERLEILRAGRRDLPRGAARRRPLPRHAGRPSPCCCRVQSVGVMGDGRTYDDVDRPARRHHRGLHDRRLGPPALRPAGPGRAAASSTRSAGVNRVVYDITSKPPATIEWE